MADSGGTFPVHALSHPRRPFTPCDQMRSDACTAAEAGRHKRHSASRSASRGVRSPASRRLIPAATDGRLPCHKQMPLTLRKDETPWPRVHEMTGSGKRMAVHCIIH